MLLRLNCLALVVRRSVSGAWNCITFFSWQYNVEDLMQSAAQKAGPTILQISLAWLLFYFIFSKAFPFSCLFFFLPTYMHMPSVLTSPGSCISNFCLPRASPWRQQFCLVFLFVGFFFFEHLTELKPAWPSLVLQSFHWLETDTASIIPAREESCARVPRLLYSGYGVPLWCVSVQQFLSYCISMVGGQMKMLFRTALYLLNSVQDEREQSLSV